MRSRLFGYPLPADPDLADLNAFLGGERVAAVPHHVLTQSGSEAKVLVLPDDSRSCSGPARGLDEASGQPSADVDIRCGLPPGTKENTFAGAPSLTGA